MKRELRELIEAYRSKASELIPRLSESLGFELPMANNEWAGFNIPQRGQTAEGLHYFKHGYGVAVKYDGGEIDIDFGDNGEYDGFEGNRLFRFAVENNIRIPYGNAQELVADIKEAESKGEVWYSGYILYYLNNNR